MRKFILLTFLFLFIPLFVICFLAHFDNADKDFNSNSNIISLQKKASFDSLDILFVGNSYCYSGIQPSLFDSLGISTFNLGIATAGPVFYELIIRDYLNSVQRKPKFIFLLLSPMTFSGKADNFLAYPIHRYLNASFSNLEIAFKYNRMSDLPVLYRKSLKKGITNLLKKGPPIDYTDFYRFKGFLPDSQTVTKEIIEKDEHEYTSFAKDKFQDEKTNSLLGIINELELKGIQVVLFELPTHLLESYFNQDYLKEYESAIKNLGKQNTVLKIDRSSFTSDDFRNIDHLNSRGSELATLMLLDEIQKHPDWMRMIRKK